MFQRIHIENLGPLADATVRLSPMGTTTITAQSEAGKTTVLTALMLATTGRDVDGRPLDVAYIRDGASMAAVDLVAASGLTLRRTVDREGNKDRFFNGVRVRKEEDWRRDLRGVAKRVVGGGSEYDVARLVACPMQWHALWKGSSQGRALRDIIAPTDADSFRAAVAAALEEVGLILADDDRIDLKAAENHRTEVNRNKSKADGALLEAQTATARIAENPPAVPSETEVANARRALERADEWARYDVAVRDHQRAVSHADEARARRDRWVARLAELDKEIADAVAAVPVEAPTSDDIVIAQVAYNECVERYQHIQAEMLAKVQRRQHLAAEPTDHEETMVAEAWTACSDLHQRLNEANDHGDDGPCPTCGHAGFDWRGEARRLEAELAAAKEVLAKAKAAADAARSKAAVDLGVRERELDTAIAADSAALARVSLQENEAAALLTKLRDALQSAERAADRVLALKRERERAAADEPVAPALVGDAPVAPDGDRLDPAQPVAARVLLEEHTRSQGAVGQHAAQLEAARKRLAAAEAEAARWEQASARAEALVVAVRAAPSRLFDAGVAAMGELHGVEFVLTDTGIDVLVDGRPWACASDGRQVFADACIRDGLRRRFRMAWFPLFIDGAQDWTGSFDAISGPKVVLVTDRNAEGLVVTHEEPAQAGEAAA